MAASSPFSGEALARKVALITGGGSGIGLEIAKQFGRHGAKVCIMGRRKNALDAAVSELRADGIQAIAVDGDVRKDADAVRAIQQTVSELGRLDILVNGAAGNFLVPAEDLSVNGFRTVLDIDTVGTFNMSTKALPYLKRGGAGKQASEGGLIINISATLQLAAVWYQVHVSAAKAGIDSMTRNLALEWGVEYGVRVNGIAPGPIKDTPGMSKLAPVEIDRRMSPAWGEKWDIAMACVYLASDAGKYVSGACIPVDGGSWFFKAPYFPKDTVRSISRQVEKKSREQQQLSKL